MERREGKREEMKRREERRKEEERKNEGEGEKKERRSKLKALVFRGHCWVNSMGGFRINSPFEKLTEL